MVVGYFNVSCFAVAKSCSVSLFANDATVNKLFTRIKQRKRGGGRGGPIQKGKTKEACRQEIGRLRADAGEMVRTGYSFSMVTFFRNPVTNSPMDLFTFWFFR